MELGEIVGLLLGGSVIGSALTWWLGTRDLHLRRRIQTLEVFSAISAKAHGYREGAADTAVGTGEQIAAMYLLADLANRDKWLKTAAIVQLDEQTRWLDGTPGTAEHLLTAARSARSMIR